MARKFSELRSKMSPAARAESDLEYARMVEQMPLRKLRAARELTQENLANVLHVKQSEISKIERRTDMYVSTLASYVKAMGGQLEVRATFSDGSVVGIDQFEVPEQKPARQKPKVRSGGRNSLVLAGPRKQRDRP